MAVEDREGAFHQRGGVKAHILASPVGPAAFSQWSLELLEKGVGRGKALSELQAPRFLNQVFSFFICNRNTDWGMDHKLKCHGARRVMK